MKPDNWNRFAAGLLAILLCLCSFSMPAFASGTDPAPEPLPEIIEEEPTTGGKIQQLTVVTFATEILRQLLGDDMAAATYLATYVYDNLGHKLKILAVNC